MARSRSSIAMLLPAALLASAAVSLPAHAQRRAHHPAHHSAYRSAYRSAREAVHQASAVGRASERDDYSLEIVAALFPYDDGMIRGEPVLTLVVENRGTAPAPAFSVDVTQRTRLASFSRAPVAMLAPGERAIVQIPLEMMPSGAPCVAVTLDLWSRQGPPAQLFAALPVAPASPASPASPVLSEQ